MSMKRTLLYAAAFLIGFLPFYFGARSGRPNNGFGRAAVLLGAVALPLAYFPLTHFFAIPLAVLGLAFGIIGLFRANREKATAIGGTIYAAVALVPTVLLAALFISTNDPGGTDEPATAQAPSISQEVGEDAEAAADVAPTGTLENPFPLGTMVHDDFQEWDITINSVTLNANAMVQETGYVSPFEPASQYILVNATFTYTGEGDTYPPDNFIWYVTASGDKWVPASTAEAPDPVPETQVSTGQSVTGNIVISVPPTEVSAEGGAISVPRGFGEAAYVALN